MDKRSKRIEAPDKKIDTKAKDRGDLKKANDLPIRKNAAENTPTGEIVKLAFPDRGDSDRKTLNNQKPEKIRLNIVVKKPTQEEPKLKNGIDSTVSKETAVKKNTDNDGQTKAPPNVELRKRIRDKYTLKLKSVNRSMPSNSILNKKEEASQVAAVKSDVNKNVPADCIKKQFKEETTQTEDKLNYSSNSSGKTDVSRDKKQENTSVRRKPIIKTIMSKNGSVRIFKAVTFVDHRGSPTPLEIKIPGVKKQKSSKFTDTSSIKHKTKPTVSRVSIKEKPVTVRKKTDKKRDRKRRHVPSPDHSVRDNRSPPTEVAKWVPSCIDRHTKPYYEAWVNTTLAAISKCSKKDQLFYKKQRESILQSFQRALEERPPSPELFYEKFADERYTVLDDAPLPLPEIRAVAS